MNVPQTPGSRLDAHVDRYAARARSMTASEIRALFSVATRPEVVSLAGGMPYLDALPIDAVGEVVRRLVQGAAKDLQRRGIRAIEAFGDGKWEKPGCVVPADHLLAVGFKTVRPHPRFPRLRLELKNALSWREDVEVALERLLGSMQPEPVFRPV